MNVGNTSELNNAISCYNSQTLADIYAINFTADVTLDITSTVISNATPGVTLAINGNNQTLNGAATYRGLEIGSNTNVTITELTIRDGQATTNGGGVVNRGVLYITSSTLSANSARFGGGIMNLGSLTLDNSELSGNAADIGGGLYNQGTLTVDFSTFSQNTAMFGGGLLNSSRGTVSVNISRISGNQANVNPDTVTNVGGGIYNSGQMMVLKTNVSGNLAGNSLRGVAGGIYNNSSGTLTVSDSTLSVNRAWDGGGIANQGMLAVSNSTLNDNLSIAFGGAITNRNGQNNKLTISNSTLSGNRVFNGSGGGLYNSGALTVTNSTLSDNWARNSFGSGISNFGPLTLNNTIIANSANDEDCLNGANGTITSQTHNLIEGAACGITNGANGSIIGQDPVLDPLAYNGGFDQTHALLAASPAIDHGDAATCAAAPINNLDQNGVNRPQGAACDIGAFEYIPPLVCNFPATVSTTAELNDAISCYNSQTTANLYTINFTTAITLDTASRVIHNTNPGVALQIHGNDHMLSGATTYRGLEIGSDTNVTIEGLTVSDGQADTGGGILNYGTLTLNSSTLSANSARTGGGIDNEGTLTVTNGTFSDNAAEFMGGGIWNEGTLTVQGNFFFNSANNGDGGGILNAAGMLTVNSSTFFFNSAMQRGGGLYNEGMLTISDSVFQYNSANDGGGLYNRSDNMLTLITSYFIANSANNGDGGGLYNSGPLTMNHTVLSDNSANSDANANGGGIYNSFGGALTMTDSTLSDNSTRDSGGGIHNRGSLTVSNSTFSANAAKFGGGITSFGTLLVTNSTLSGNAASQAFLGGGGINNAGEGKLTLNNTIIANSANGGDCFSGDSATLTSQTHNLIEDSANACGIANGANGSIIGQDPVLDLLAYSSGGFGATHAILAGSPAIDQGDAAICDTSPFDNFAQNGVIRPLGIACDIGAFEYIPPASQPLFVYKGSSGSGTVTSTPTGIDCGPTCLAVYDQDTLVTLTATPDNGSVFVGWRGSCTGTDACQVMLDNIKTVIADFDKVGTTTQVLTVSKAGNGSGTVQSTPAGIDCGPACSIAFAQDPGVTLIPIADADSIFVGWSGACTGTGACTVTLDAAKSVVATFDKANVATPLLTVSPNGSGAGRVTSSPTGIDCGATCDFAFAQGTLVNLTATADAGSTFAGWGGACTGTGACQVTLDEAKSVLATFDKVKVTNLSLTVSKAGSGTGNVKDTPGNIDCGATCSFAFAHGHQVTLIATADAGSTFAGWNGCPLITGTACEVTMDAAKSVTAKFDKINVADPILTVSTNGSGSGAVTSTPGGINCGLTCSAPFTQGTVVTLTATSEEGATFAGWGGACTGTGACLVTLDSAKAVTATFNLLPPPNQTLSVTKAGNGTGKVTSSVAGIDCGATCSFAFAHGAAVTLTATPDAGSTFAGWSGACTGAGTCTVTLNSAKTVIADFNKVGTTTQLLSVSKADNGSGTVKSTPAGIDCGSACNFAFVQNQQVTLAATPAAGSSFAGWGGACTGTGACLVTMDTAKSVVATFKLVPPTNQILNLTKAGSGAGKVISSVAGIDCGATCSFAFAHGAAVTLTATPDAGSTFAGWSGACTGTGSCTVTLNSATTVIADFNKVGATTQLLTVGKAGNGSGTVKSTPAGVDCGATCSFAFAQNAVVTLTATADAGSTFGGWSGACTGTGTCQVTLDAAKSVAATFTLIPPQSVSLTVSKTGSGSGAVTSSPAGITCGTTCSASFAQNSVVTLTATPDAGSTFGGWSGACTGTGSCQVTLDAAKTVAAAFSPQNSSQTNQLFLPLVRR